MLTEVTIVIAMRDIPMNLKMMKRCKKLFLIFIRTEIAGYDYKQDQKGSNMKLRKKELKYGIRNYKNR